MSDKIIRHFSHDQHALSLSEFCRALNCTICNGPISKGETVYVCSRFYNCTWFFYQAIHKNCAEFPQHITSHSLHPLDHHSLTLANTSFKSNILCHYCDKPFSGTGAGECYAYSCDHQQCPDFRMHPACGAVPLPSPIAPSNAVDDDDVIRFSCHNRPMALRNGDISGSEGGSCFACQLPWSGPAYSCESTRQCPNFFHKLCGDGLRRRITRHPFHPRHALTLRVSNPRPCGPCGKKDCRLIYHCSDEGCCGFAMCTECASYNSAVVECRSHDHLLCLVEKARCDDVVRCHACETSYAEKWADGVPEEVRRTKSLVFRCMESHKECTFDLHFLCGPLPCRIEYEFHLHPLILVDASTVDDDGCSDEYYCDACEEERDPQFRVYYCKDCKYVAHIHCVLLQIMKVVKGDHNKDLKLIALGEDRWDFEIEPTNNDDQEEGHNQELTMRDIMQTLTEEELQRLRNPLNLDTESRAATINSYHYFRHLSSEYIGLEAHVENIDRVQKLFLVNLDKFYEFRAEVYNFVADEGLKLDDEYLRQKVEHVEGYKVPKTLAPILRTLLRKNKELVRSANSGCLTPAMKSAAAALLCIEVERMCRTKFEDITRDDLIQWCFNLHAIGKVIDFSTVYGYLKPLQDFAMRIFLGNEANRCRREARKKLAREVETLEAKLKRCKENYQKLETAETSGFMEECLSLASEFKGKYYADKLL